MEQSYEKAAEYFRLAAEQDDMTSQYQLGRMYPYSRGVEQSYEKAAELFVKAAEQGGKRNGRTVPPFRFAMV